MSKVATLLGES